MRHTSIKLNTPCEIINIVPFNPLISKCQIKVCYVGDTPNRNKSIITKDTARKLANSLPGSPIVGHYNPNNKDFESHNRKLEIVDGQIKFIDDTRPYGFVDLNAKVWFQKYLDDGIHEREYLVTEGWLWTGQYPECQRVIDKGDNQSMELDENPNFLNAHWTKDGNGKPQFFIINEAIMSKLCILGEDTEPCFEGSSIENADEDVYANIKFSLEDSFKNELFSLMEQMKEILNKGGAPVDTLENKVDEVVTEETVATEEEVVTTEETVEETVVEEAAAITEEEVATKEETEFAKKDEEEQEEKEEICEDCGKPVSECTCDKEDEDEEDKKKNTYTLEEIPEYVELSQNYSELQESYAQLQAQVSDLEAQLATLTEFEASIKRQEKEAMIEKFYMLSDADKADVIANIDTYSVDDIEAKLSVICVRNKVNFDLDENNTPSTTFNLNSEEMNDATPAWLKAVQSVQKSMNS